MSIMQPMLKGTSASNAVSVALCTRNGEAYLEQLLASIANQSLSPREIVASDDASEDATRYILEEFARQAGFPVLIHANPAALGVTRNFEHAIGLCSGDIIALADQDDVWHADKLARLADALSAPGVHAVFSDAMVVDAELAPLGYGMWQRVRFTSDEQRRLTDGDGLAVLLKHRIVTGATLAFKSSLRGAALPIPDSWAHDAWLALIASAAGHLVPIRQPLVLYRQHAGNVVGGRKSSVFQQAAAALRLDRSAWYREEIERWAELRERLVALGLSGRHIELVSGKLDHLQTRANLPASRILRIPFILREVVTGRYRHFARNWGSIAIDLLVR
jgi:glycosyltransferase involved in cell wall biosynthesis